MSQHALGEHILSLDRFAVTGASRNTDKYGYKVYRALKDAGKTVYPVNPNAEEVDGDVCYPNLDTLPETVDCVVTVTPPAVTEHTMREAGRLGIGYGWMQPGSGSEAAYNVARANSIQAVSGPCILVELREKQAREALFG